MKISIITATYNRIETLPRALLSVQAQDYTNKELVKTCSKLTGNKDINKVNSQRIFIILIIIN